MDEQCNRNLVKHILGGKEAVVLLEDGLIKVNM